MTGLVRYAEFTADDFDKEVERANQMSGNIFFDLAEGENIVRFVPAPLGQSPILSNAMHFIKDVPGMDRVAAFACPMKSSGQACVVCQRAAVMAASKDPAQVKQARDLKPQVKVLSNVITRTAQPDDPSYGLRILRYGKQVLAQLKTIRRSAASGGDFYNPGPEGFDIIISKSGSGFDTDYKVLPDRRPSPLHPDAAIVQHLIDNQYALGQHVTTEIPDAVLFAFGASPQVSPGAPTTYATAAPQTSPAQAAYAAPPTTVVVPYGQQVGAGMFAPVGNAVVPPPVAPPAGNAVVDADFSEDDDDEFGPGDFE